MLHQQHYLIMFHQILIYLIIWKYLIVVYIIIKLKHLF